MSDIIQLLPDSVANQIAAGEVVQRPASAVKELMENAIDAGADSIKLIVKDAGKTLIQLIDNGSGMSQTDARMCFERHATSKIKKAEDLFEIRSFGFRGEAMASIAAVAQVELKTKKQSDDLGIAINIEGSSIKSQEPCQCSEGTSIAVKNLFYNIPARRNFLKSDQIEVRHIIEEFQRVALAHPEIAFSFYNNENEIFHLNKNSFRHRIIGIFGDNYNQRLVPVEEDTNIVKITGFVGKPEFSKKTRGEQYFYVNNRFIKSPYLNNAVQAAFEDFIPNGNFPSYFLKLEINPASIDINIHPTKTEIKFEDERSIYAIIRSAVKQALGKFHITPTLDFDQETSFNLPYSYKDSEIKIPEIKVNTSFNPFTNVSSGKNPSLKPNLEFNNDTDNRYRFNSEENPRAELDKNNQNNWGKLYQDFNTPSDFSERDEISDTQQKLNTEIQDEPGLNKKLKYQLHQTYILTNIKKGLMLIDQNRAHERILYERFLNCLNTQKGVSQQSLFPQTIEFQTIEFELIKELIHDFNALGFDISEFGKNTLVVNGTPTGVQESETKEIIERVIEDYKNNLGDLKLNKNENLARTMAKKLAIKPGKNLSEQEIDNLIDELFACETPFSSPNGKPVLINLTLEELAQKFLK